MTSRPLCVVLAFLAFLVLASCSSTATPSQPPPTVSVPVVGGGVLATVDGTAITRADLELATPSGPSPHGGEVPTPEALLEHIIQQQLLANRAVAAHLDRDEDYQQELARREAQLAAWKRDQLSELYERRQAAHQPPVTEADARRYYDENASHVRTEIRVAQILMRDQTRIDQALRDLRAGTTFDEVAARQFPNVPDLANKPWELAFLRWNQLPEPWRAVIDGVAVGQTSDVIRGTNNRFWIIKVLERRENPDLTFEATRPLITALIQEQRRVEARARLDREARESAHVVYAHPPSRPAPAP